MEEYDIQQKFRSFSNSLERGWTVWAINGEPVEVVADEAHYSEGVLSLCDKTIGVVGTFNKFRAAIQDAHANFGLEQYWVNDGMKSHVVEANMHSWDSNGNLEFMQVNDETNTDRLVAVFQNADWWVRRNSRMWSD